MTVTENGLTIPAVWLVNWLWNLQKYSYSIVTELGLVRHSLAIVLMAQCDFTHNDVGGMQIYFSKPNVPDLKTPNW